MIITIINNDVMIMRIKIKKIITAFQHLESCHKSLTHKPISFQVKRGSHG